jgi:hypothetical protein
VEVGFLRVVSIKEPPVLLKKILNKITVSSRFFKELGGFPATIGQRTGGSVQVL